ncbi:condensation domain-containing protein, partial [Aquimarina algiphila]
KASTLEAYTHQRYPFDRLVEELDLHRDVSRSAVFDVMVVLQNTRDIVDFDIDILDRNTVVEDLGPAVSKFDISFDFREVGGCLSLTLEYNEDVYDRFLIEGFIGHYFDFLAIMLDNVSTP